ncbi:MAG: hypothetical protein R3B47_16515, partial [Bacteroidia bacterium]
FYIKECYFLFYGVFSIQWDVTNMDYIQRSFKSEIVGGEYYFDSIDYEMAIQYRHGELLFEERPQFQKRMWPITDKYEPFFNGNCIELGNIPKSFRPQDNK